MRVTVHMENGLSTTIDRATFIDVETDPAGETVIGGFRFRVLGEPVVIKGRPGHPAVLVDIVKLPENEDTPMLSFEAGDVVGEQDPVAVQL